MIYKSLYFYNYETFLRCPSDILKATSHIYLPYESFCNEKVQQKANDIRKGTDLIAVLPYINKGNERRNFESVFERICQFTDGFMLQNIGDKIIIDTLMQQYDITGKTLYGDYSLNIYNAETAKFWVEYSLKSVTLSPEMELPEQIELANKIHGNIMPEILCNGRVIVMRSEHCFVSQTAKFHCGKCGTNGFSGYTLKDNAENVFPIIGCNRDCQNIILSAKPVAHNATEIKKRLFNNVVLRYNVFNKNDINDLKKKGWLQL